MKTRENEKDEDRRVQSPRRKHKTLMFWVANANKLWFLLQTRALVLTFLLIHNAHVIEVHRQQLSIIKKYAPCPMRLLLCSADCLLVSLFNLIKDVFK